MSKILDPNAPSGASTAAPHFMIAKMRLKIAKMMPKIAQMRLRMAKKRPNQFVTSRKKQGLRS